MKSDLIFTASDGEKLPVTTYGSNTGENTRCVFYVHGFKGFKDWGFVPYIGEYLANKGFFALAFNFSHNGIGDQPTEFTEPDKFARNTLSREVQELSELVEAVKGGFFGSVNNSRIGLLGHSRGGGITLLTSAIKKEIGAAVVWSAVSSFNRFSEDHRAKWRKDGYIEVVNQRTGQVMRLNKTLLEDFEIHQDNLLNIEKAVKNLPCPLLVVHGEEDESVPVSEGQQIHKWADPTASELLMVPNTGHTFGARHPFDGSNDKLDFVLERSAVFFDKNL
jgi:dienelactone hydrolase